VRAEAAVGLFQSPRLRCEIAAVDSSDDWRLIQTRAGTDHICPGADNYRAARGSNQRDLEGFFRSSAKVPASCAAARSRRMPVLAGARTAAAGALGIDHLVQPMGDPCGLAGAGSARNDAVTSRKASD